MISTDDISIFCKLMHELNALIPIVFTDEGIDTFFNLTQLWNILSGISVIKYWISICSNFEQLWKTPFPKYITDDGIIIDIRDVQEEKQ